MKTNSSTTEWFKKTAIVLLLLLLAGCSNPGDGGDTGGVMVSASFYPLAEFAHQVGGEKVEVFQVTPAGASPHEFEPTARDIVKIYKSKLILINGAGLDPWAENLQIEHINMSEKINLLEGAGHEGHEDEHQHLQDPHFWLDPVIAIEEVTIIRDALIKADPKNEKTYTENARQYITELETLNKKFKTGLANCEKNEIITSHSAFGYMADRYGFEQIGIAGISSQEEPSMKRLAELAELAKEKEIKYIFFETLVSPKLAETLAGEVGAETLVLNTVSGLTQEDIDSNKNYVKLMNENLQNLRIALECQ